ncbi:hypothetical protein ACTXT7_015419 [Hymenolepis weldensis]
MDSSLKALEFSRFVFIHRTDINRDSQVIQGVLDHRKRKQNKCTSGAAVNVLVCYVRGHGNVQLHWSSLANKKVGGIRVSH